MGSLPSGLKPSHLQIEGDASGRLQDIGPGVDYTILTSDYTDILGVSGRYQIISGTHLPRPLGEHCDSMHRADMLGV